MKLDRRTVIGAGAASLLPLSRSRAQRTVVKVGVLADMSGPYRDLLGPTGVICAKQAVEDLGDLGFDVEIVGGDHQNKPDVGSALARQWYDVDGVDMIIGLPNSSVALAVMQVTKQKNKVVIGASVGTTEFTGAQCTQNSINWTYDTYMLGRSTGGATVREGGDTWFFVTADYAFGKQLQADTSAFVKEAGGKVLGSVSYPFPGTTDFASFLLQAQSSGAKVIGFANAGADLATCIKQSKEFGISPSMKMAALNMFICDVKALGLATASGLVLTESFYWDLNDRTRAFTKRVAPKTPDNWPGMAHAGAYAGTMHYLKAVAKLGLTAAKKDGSAVVKQMKAMPTDDDAFGACSIREDGRCLVQAHLFEVKSAAESRGDWDYYKLLRTTPGTEAFQPLSQSACPLLKG